MTAAIPKAATTTRGVITAHASSTGVSPMTSAELVCSVSDPAWLDRRREGITATDIVTIAGLVTWDSPWALYHRKLGLLPEVEQSDRLWVGLMLQEAIKDRWYRSHSAAMPPEQGLFRSSARLWQMATPDYAWPDSVLECKTADRHQTGWGPDGSDQVPTAVRAQVLWQMDTLGVAIGHVAVVFLPSGEFRSYTIRHDNGIQHDTTRLMLGCPVCVEVDGLRDLGSGFWSRILRRDPPDLDGLEVTTDALRYLHPAPRDDMTAIPRGLLMAYDSAAEAKKEADQQYKLAQNLVRDALGQVNRGSVDGKEVFRRTISKRAGYTVPPGEVDQLRRIGKDKTDAD